MKSLLLDESATGNAVFLGTIIVVAVLFAGAAANIMGYGMNILLDVHNQNVASGIASEQTANNMIFARNMFRMLGFILVIGAIIWGKMHSNSEDTFVDASLLIGAALAMYIFTFVSMLLTLIFGMQLDIMLPIFNNVVDLSGTSWEGVDNVSRPVSVIYFICQLPIVAGIIVYILAAIRKTSGETYDVTEYQTMVVD